MNRRNPLPPWLSLVLCGAAALSAAGCSSGDTIAATTSGTAASCGGTTSGDLPAAFSKFVSTSAYGSSVTVCRDGDTIIIVSNGIPNHKSPYFSSSDARYEAYNGGDTFSKNPNSIAEQDFEFRIPVSPQEATNKSATALGPIGVSLNGVPFYNQYAGPNNQALTNEIYSFDQYKGHPQQAGQYHYHVEPLALTASQGKDALLGFLLDGFPVYGPQENGATITNADLDDYHGHFAATADYPAGIYHYHITDADPYINGNGFYGTPGTVTQ